MRVNLFRTLIGIEFVFELFLRFAITPNPKEYSSYALENHKIKHPTHCVTCPTSRTTETGKKNYHIEFVYRKFTYPYPTCKDNYNVLLE